MRVGGRIGAFLAPVPGGRIAGYEAVFRSPVGNNSSFLLLEGFELTTCAITPGPREVLWPLLFWFATWG